MYKTPAPWSSKSPVREKSAMGGSAHLRPLQSQLQQKNTAISAVCPVREKLP